MATVLRNIMPDFRSGLLSDAWRLAVPYYNSEERWSARLLLDDPGAVRLDRDQSGTLLYGAGIDVCMGAPLARLEAQVALPAVIRRFPRLTVREPLRRRVSLTLRGFLRVPLSGLS